MNGMEAKYTAKHLAKMIKHNRKVEKRNRKSYDLRNNDFDLQTVETMDKFAVAQFVQKETQKLSQEFRAFMIHNAFKKKRDFTTAEVEYYHPYMINMNNYDAATYGYLAERMRKQQNAIAIVEHTMLDKNERPEFLKWIANTANTRMTDFINLDEAVNIIAYSSSHKEAIAKLKETFKL
jgi:hypothetical protein